MFKPQFYDFIIVKIYIEYKNLSDDLDVQI